MTDIAKKTEIKQVRYMMSQHPEPPFLLFRWVYDTGAKPPINEFRRFDPEVGEWVLHDNDFIRDNFMGYKFDLKIVDPVPTDEEAMELATVGWRAKRFV